MADGAASSKAARNEQRKLAAQTINAMGLGVFAVGGLQPLFTGHFDVGTALKVAVSATIAYVLRMGGKRSLRGLED